MEPFKVTKNFLVKASVVLVIAILIGTLHGLYVSGQRKTQSQFFTGSDLCHGEYLQGKINTFELGTRLRLNYKVAVHKGEMILALFNPQGEPVFTKTDSSAIFRQHAINIDEESKLGEWYFYLDCNKADMDYELSIRIDDKEE